MGLISAFNAQTEEYRKLERELIENLINMVQNTDLGLPKGIKPIGNSGIKAYSVPSSVLFKAESWSVKTLIPQYQQNAIVEKLQNAQTATAAKKIIQDCLDNGYIKQGGEKIVINKTVKDFLESLF